MIFPDEGNCFQQINLVYALFNFKKLQKWKTYIKGYKEILKKKQCKRERYFLFPLIFLPKQLVQYLHLYLFKFWRCRNEKAL
jgi:hypothetical protein